MRNKIIFSSIIPAVRIFTGDKNILFKVSPDEFPTAERVEFYPSMGGGTTISLQTAMGTELKDWLVNEDYAKFEQYGHIVDKLPIMGDKVDHPIYRVQVTVKVDSTTIELIDYNRNENATYLKN